MINLNEKDMNRSLGQITEDQLQYLIDNLEEEWLEDQDYAITPLLLEYFEAQGADAALVTLLRNALAGRDEIEIVWSKNA
jgi:processive 1,2-diacylglycerol beta-glucosyltransferase